MKYIIAEKPSLGRAIADQIKGKKRNGKNCIIVNEEYMVGWLVGHVLELAEPDQYNQDFKKWELSHLPIIPNEWKLVPCENSKEILQSVKENLEKATVVINAGDPDREGQLLVDEVLEYLGWKGKTQRLLVNDPSPLGVQKALKNIQDNSVFASLYQSGLARQRSDWLLGINLTRQYTLNAQAKGYRGVISVGRVQTPVLGLVVNRYLEIQNFKAKDFYTLGTHIRGVFFGLTFNENISDFLDDSGRLIDKNKAEELKDKINNKEGVILSVDQTERKENVPMPFSLSDIQVYANKAFDFSAQHTLDICQSLYEKHKATTYPRSDCSYLPEEQYPDRLNVISVIYANFPDYEKISIDTNIKSRAFNSKKVTAHHGIIPTENKVDLSKFSQDELKIYQAVCERYLFQFLPPYRFKETSVIAEVEGEILSCTGNELIDLGYKKYTTQKASEDVLLPNFKKGEQVQTQNAELESKKTSAPKLFTEATLLTAMQNIAKYVTDPLFKKVLRETDGIGTPATQSQIIETLFKRNYIDKQKKNIIPTELGIALIQIVPDATSKPDLTAYWEQSMKKIEEKEKPFTEFMNGIYQYIPKLLEESKKHDFKVIPVNALVCPKCGKESVFENKSAYNCNDDDCEFVVFKTIAGKKLSNKTIEGLISKGKTAELKGFVSKSEKEFSAALEFDENHKVKFVFSEKKNSFGSKGGKNSNFKKKKKW